MKSNEKTVNTKELFRDYTDYRGVSSSCSKAAGRSFMQLQNMYIDYEEDAEAIVSIPGFRKIHATEGRIHSLAIQSVGKERFIIFHLDGGLYRLKYNGEKVEKIGEINDADSHMLVFSDLCVINDGRGIYLVDGGGRISLISDEGYIVGCRNAVIFDGRLFTSGNREQKGKIFYSSRLDSGEIVFSKEGFIQSGKEVLGLLSAGGRLFAFCDVEIICFVAREGYPVCLSLGGVRPTGQAIFSDNEVLFLTSDGLMAIENPLSYSEARLRPRSRDIAPMLAREDMLSAGLCSWVGYTAILCGSNIYLGDPRGEPTYDWYPLSKIGSYFGDRWVYRYSSSADSGYLVHKNTHRTAEGEVISLKDEKGKLIYYVEDGGKKYSVYPTSERCGGDFSPAETVVSDGKLLCFSTREGIFLFNNDMRGADVSDGEGMLHPRFYSFDGHAPSYLVATAYDSVGLPVTEKTSVGESLYLKLKGPGKRSLTVTVMTDRGPASRQSLGALPHSCREYGGKERASIIGIPERAHGWIEKQIIIEGNEFASPFGICSMAFKYQPKENLKKG